MSDSAISSKPSPAHRSVITKGPAGLSVPNVMFMFMQRPDFLWVAPASDGLLIERKFDGSFLRTLGHNLLRRRRGWKKIHLSTNDFHSATFRDDRGLIPNGSYELGDYYPMFQLFPIAADTPVSDSPERATINAQTWASIADYHEHLGLADQHSTAHEVSKMMARTVGTLVTAPRRILELGCGSGRNLYWMSQAFPEAEIVGVDINPSANIKDFLPDNVTFLQENILQLDFEKIGRFDAIFTCGFLMHINHQDVRPLLEKVHAHSDYSLFFELHGPANPWDFHRYPRNYQVLFDDLGLPIDDYTVYGPDDVYSHDLGGPFSHALLESSHPLTS
jgi:SAM-dependent methyltransferase